jgi:hypothetical protein
MMSPEKKISCEEKQCLRSNEKHFILMQSENLWTVGQNALECRVIIYLFITFSMTLSVVQTININNEKYDTSNYWKIISFKLVIKLFFLLSHSPNLPCYHTVYL